MGPPGSVDGLLAGDGIEGIVDIVILEIAEVGAIDALIAVAVRGRPPLFDDRRPGNVLAVDVFDAIFEGLAAAIRRSPLTVTVTGLATPLYLLWNEMV